MDPLSAIVALVPLITGAVRLIRGLLPDDEQKLLVKWATLLKDGPKTPEEAEKAHDWNQEVRQFLSDCTLRRGFSPAYQYQDAIEVPEDLLTDLVDLLIGGWSSGSKWALSNLMRNPMKDRQGWATTVATKKDALILTELTDWLGIRGRSRDYSPSPTIAVDRDWLADVGSFLIG